MCVCVAVQAVQQEKHTLQRKLDVCEMEAAQREHELQADLATQRKQLEQQHAQGKGRRREESEQLTQLSNHNQKLVEQLAEVRHPQEAHIYFLFTKIRCKTCMNSHHRKT